MQLDHLKLAITGSFGAKDIGDEAMLTEDLHYVIHQCGIPRRNIFLFGWEPNYISRYHEHPLENCFSSILLEQMIQRKQRKGIRKFTNSSRRRRAFARIDSAISESDALLITGGGTINTRDPAGGSVKRMHHLVQAFKQQRIPIFLSGQTIGPLGQYQSHDAMAKSIVESVDCLTVRDSNYSARYLSLINAQPQELVQTFDDAYTLPYEDEMLPGEVSDHMNHGNCICVNVTDYTCATGQQKSFIATLCEKLIQTYDSNLFLVSHTPADLVALWEIRDSINNQWKDRIAIPDTREWRDAKLKKLIASCRLAIGGRYHFIVFAGTSNTPFVGMCGNHYSYIKQDGFARALGQERYILTERETWDMDLLLSRVDERIDQPLNLSEKFERPSISMQRFGRWLNEKFSAGRAAAA